MPIEAHILQGGAGRLWAIHGVLSGKELIARNEESLSSKSYEGVRWLIIDESRVTSVDISTEEIRRITQQDDRLAAVLPKLVTAIIVPQDLAFGMTRMWEMLTERPGWSTRAFRTWPEAETWLREEVRSTFGMELPQDLATP
ncbi:MAG TPA: hypothetical protein VE825_00510 [Terriglobales bacterium]|jgi:hypothetical protein|nr:hypothetical protein [Terriglobales bacterium]